MLSCISKEFALEVKGRKINSTMISPLDGSLAEDPILLLAAGGDRHTSLAIHPFCMQAEQFLEAGNRVLSFDMPNHGERVNSFGSEITGLRNAFVSGSDPFKMFVEEASAIIDYCIEHGFARPGRVAVCGTSRAGYMALRLMAEDNRVFAAAALAPVTDWCYLSEFSDEKDRADVKNLRLSLYCKGLVGKPVFLAIGNHDERVSTASCCRFYLNLLDENAANGYDSSNIDFYCTDDIGHSLGDYWRKLGGEFLLKKATDENIMRRQMFPPL